MASFPWITTLSTLVATYILLYVIQSLFPSQKLRHIPSVGCRSDSLLDYWKGAFHYFKHGHAVVQEGYTKLGGRPFKVPTISGWIVVFPDSKTIDEIKRAHDDTLSMPAVVQDSLQLDYTLGPQVAINDYHINVIRTPLTRNMQYYYPEIREEILTAFAEEIPIPDDGNWHSIQMWDPVLRVICRASNRLFVGLPACRDPEYIKLATNFAMDVVKSSIFINMFPRFLRPAIGPLVGPLSSGVKRCRRILGPTIQDRLAKYQEFGRDWEGKPNDLISWLIDHGAHSTEPLDVENIILRILAINFAALHTTSSAFANALYDLAARPHYIEPLRQEIETVVERQGWSKASMFDLKKMDSFIKESQRMAGANAVSSLRKAMRDVTFADGTAVPAGTVLGAPGLSIQFDERHYSNPLEFDGFRFSEMRSVEGESTKHHCVTLDPSYMPFGFGRHACPGRFFAILEVKNLLATTILNYDIKFEEGQRPDSLWISGNPMPNHSVKLSIRKRQGESKGL